LPLEDFEAGRVPDANVVGCPGPLDATSDNLCFSRGDIKPGIRFNSDHHHGQNEGGQELALLGTGFGGPTTKQLVATFDSDAFVIDFTTSGTPVAGGATPDHTYAHDGTFTVSLTVSNGSRTGTATTTATIAPAPVPPVAKAGGPYSGFEGNAVEFDGTASSDPNGAPLTYQWNFGDGTLPVDGARPSHTYA